MLGGVWSILRDTPDHNSHDKEETRLSPILLPLSCLLSPEWRPSRVALVDGPGHLQRTLRVQEQKQGAWHC